MDTPSSAVHTMQNRTAHVDAENVRYERCARIHLSCEGNEQSQKIIIKGVWILLNGLIHTLACSRVTVSNAALLSKLKCGFS